MEDTHCVHITVEEACFCVYDGHGGLHAAQFARDHLHLNIMAALNRSAAPRLAALQEVDAEAAAFLQGGFLVVPETTHAGLGSVS